MWNAGRRVVEEVDSDEDSDSQGVGLASSGGSRFVSDPLHFTGIDMGDGDGGRSRSSLIYGQGAEEDDDTTSEEDDSDQDVEVRGGHAAAASSAREEAVVESALERIRRAQAKGKKDVRLTQEELAALERRRERIHAQEEARKRRKEREQRFAVPLSHLEPTVRKRRPPVAADEGVPQQAASGSSREDPGRPVYPPMGYFPPPLASTRTRARSGTASSQRPPSRDPTAERSRGNSPFRYSYVQHAYPPSAYRHVSDTAPRPHTSSSRQDSWPGTYGQEPPASLFAPSIPAQRQSSVDPFRYLTTDSRAPAGRRNASGPPAGTRHHVYGPGTVPQDPGRRASPEDTSEETDSENSGSTSGGYGVSRVPSSGSVGGAPVVGNRPGRSREEVIVIEDSPEPEPQPEVRREREPSTARSKKPAGGSSPVKRKPVSGGTGKRRKGR